MGDAYARSPTFLKPGRAPRFKISPPVRVLHAGLPLGRNTQIALLRPHYFGQPIFLEIYAGMLRRVFDDYRFFARYNVNCCALMRPRQAMSARIFILTFISASRRAWWDEGLPPACRGDFPGRCHDATVHLSHIGKRQIWWAIDIIFSIMIDTTQFHLRDDFAERAYAGYIPQSHLLYWYDADWWLTPMRAGDGIHAFLAQQHAAIYFTLLLKIGWRRYSTFH